MLFQALPYVLTLVAVAGLIGRSTPPAAVGRPYQAITAGRRAPPARGCRCSSGCSRSRSCPRRSSATRCVGGVRPPARRRCDPARRRPGLRCDPPRATCPVTARADTRTPPRHRTARVGAAARLARPASGADRSRLGRRLRDALLRGRLGRSPGRYHARVQSARACAQPVSAARSTSRRRRYGTKIRSRYLRALEEERFELLSLAHVHQGLSPTVRRVSRPRRPAVRRRVQLALCDRREDGPVRARRVRRRGQERPTGASRESFCSP